MSEVKDVEHYSSELLKNLSKHADLDRLLGRAIRKAMQKPDFLKAPLMYLLAMDSGRPANLERQLLEAEDIPNFSSLVSRIGENILHEKNLHGAFAELAAALYLRSNPLPSMKVNVSDIKFAPKGSPVYDISFKVDGREHLASVKSPRQFEPALRLIQNALEYESLWDDRFYRAYSFSPSFNIEYLKSGREKRQKMLYDSVYGVEEDPSKNIQKTQGLVEWLKKYFDQTDNLDEDIFSFNGGSFRVGYKKFADPNVNIMMLGGGFMSDQDAYKDYGALFPAMLNEIYSVFLEFYEKYDRVTYDKHLIYVWDLGMGHLRYREYISNAVNSMTSSLGVDDFFKTEIIFQ